MFLFHSVITYLLIEASILLISILVATIQVDLARYSPGKSSNGTRLKELSQLKTMSQNNESLSLPTENKDLCISCRNIADHWYEVDELDGDFKSWDAYSIRELLHNADNGCLLCCLIITNSDSTRQRFVEKHGSAEERVYIGVRGPMWDKKYDMNVGTEKRQLGPDIRLFESGHRMSLHHQNLWEMSVLKLGLETSAEIPIPRVFSRPRNTDNPQSWEQAKKWISECRRPAAKPSGESNSSSNHWRCQEPIMEHEFPTRLIRVGQDNSELNLCLTKDLPKPVSYVALSHCWGKHKFLVTTDGNISQMQKRIPFDQLTKSFQHSIIATRRLGLEYIWIDSLCIIQGSKIDWEVESVRMGSIYAFCTVNLIAADAEDGTVGCFFDVDQTCHLSVPVDRHDSNYRKTLYCEL